MLLVIVLFVLPAKSCRVEEEVKEEGLFLSLNLSTNDSFQTTVDLIQSLETVTEYGVQIVEQNIITELHSIVIKDSSGHYSIDNQYNRIRFYQNVSNEEKEDIINIDTREPKGNTDDELERLYYNLTEHSFESVVNSNGEEISNGYYNLLKTIQGGKFSSPFQKLLNYSIFFPDYELFEGETWNKEVYLKEDELSITGDTKYTLENWDSTFAYIKVKSHLNGRYLFFSEAMQVEVEKSGSLIVERTSGLIQEGVIEQKIKWHDHDINENRFIGTVKFSVKK